MLPSKETSSIDQSNTSTTDPSEETKHRIEEQKQKNTFLKDQVLRLNKELSLYQTNAGITLSSCDTSSSTCNSSHGIDIPKSIFDSKNVPPLFTAYDHRIAELSTIIERQGSVLDVLTQRSNDLLYENESLRNRIVQGLPTKKKACNMTEQCSRNENQETTIKQLLSDKQLLEDQAELLVKEVQSANQGITTRDETISSYLKLIQRSNEKIQRLSQDKEDCEKELVSCTGKLSIQTDQIKNLKRNIDNLKKERVQIRSKAAGADMDKHHYEVENESLTAKITQSASLIQELQSQLSLGATEYMKMNEKYLDTEKDLKRMQSKMDQSTQSNTELKFRIDLVTEKERELQGNQRELKMKIKEVELSRDKAEAKLSSLEKEVNRLVLLQTACENCVNNGNRWQKNTCEEIKRREELIHSLKIKCSQTTMQAEKDKRQNDISQSALQNLELCILRERTTTKNELETLRTELSDTRSKLKTEQLKSAEATNEQLFLQRELITVKESLTTTQGELKCMCEEEKRKSEERTEAMIQLQTKNDELNVNIQRERSRMLEEREALLLEQDRIVNQKDSEIDSVQSKIRLLEGSLKELTQMNQQVQNELKTITIEHTNEKKETDAKFQTMMLERQESYKDQVRKNDDLRSDVRSLSEEKLNLDILLKKSSHEMYETDRKLVIAEEKVSLLRKQLHDNLGSQYSRLC